MAPGMKYEDPYYAQQDVATNTRPRPKKMVELRPKFRISEVDYKALQRVCKIMDISASEWVRRQVTRSLGNE